MIPSYNVNNYQVRSVRSAGKKIKDEVCVTFSDIETREAVRAAASNLSAIPGAGMRLEVPDFLRPSLRALESVSYSMRQSTPGMRRNVKFDDEVLDLVMDVQMEPPEGKWKKIRPTGAREAKQGLVTPSREGNPEMDAESIRSFMQQTATGGNAEPMGE